MIYTREITQEEIESIEAWKQAMDRDVTVEDALDSVINDFLKSIADFKKKKDITEISTILSENPDMISGVKEMVDTKMQAASKAKAAAN